MDNTLLKMHMSIMVLGGKETMREGEKSKHVYVGNVVQVFGFKNNFPREAGYDGISRKLPWPPKWT